MRSHRCIGFHQAGHDPCVLSLWQGSVRDGGANFQLVAALAAALEATGKLDRVVDLLQFGRRVSATESLRRIFCGTPSVGLVLVPDQPCGKRASTSSIRIAEFCSSATCAVSERSSNCQ